ncbi:heterokaryon incompatibility protein-domain-containing protein [Xylariaceae sp. AK1471]|nr:heterokaryon incompatibility protein-domain-containing protein [Xylariaceae sp. AK1471]
MYPCVEWIKRQLVTMNMGNSINEDHNPQTKKRGFSRITIDQAHVQSGVLSESASDRRKCIREACTVSQVPNNLPQDDSLCGDCSKLDLQGLTQKAIQLGENGPFGTHYKQRRDILVADVGHRFRKPQETNCTLCQMLVACRYTTRQELGDDFVDDGGDEIRATWFLRRFRFESYPTIGKEDKTLCLIVVPRKFSWHVDGDYLIRDHVRSKGCAVILQDEDHTSFFAPRKIPSLFNPRTVEPWLRYCTQYHGFLCGSSSVPVPVHSFQVIDCTTLSVEEGKLGVPYVALSYVWGALETACGTVQNIDGVKMLPEQLSGVIRDSIDVTKALGYRYLWVDKFCIDQDNPGVKHDQIQQMDTIYQNSELTLIAAAGIDETYGLPGVGIRARACQPIIKARGVTVMWMPKDPHKSIKSSHWSSRGWTFQEALLSRRRLVFTDEQVYFECNTMNCSESIYCQLDKLHTKSKSKTYERVRSGIFGRIRNQKIGHLVPVKLSINAALFQYVSNIKEYSARELRYDEDSLNAFQGVIRQLLKQEHSFGNLWGLSYPANSEKGASYFVHSLTWNHKGRSRTPRRRQNFPSWSWVGWDGQVEYGFINSRILRFISRVRDLRFGNQVGDVVGLGDLPKSSQENCTYTTLYITAAAVPTGLISYQPSKGLTSISPWVVAKQRAYLSSLSDTEVDAQLARGLEDITKYQFAYIGRLSRRNMSYILVLNFDSMVDAWVRVGILIVPALYNQFTNLFIESSWKVFKII